MKFRKAIFTGLLLLAGGCAVAQQSIYTRLDSLLAAKNMRDFSGVVLIAQNGKPLYAKAMGYANRDTKEPVTMDSHFVIMSVSKQITAALVLKEVEKGHIDLQKRLRTYLPDLKDKWGDSVTIHQLLNHTSGVVWYDQPLAFTPGYQLAYSNFGYVLLQSVLEHVTGKAYTILLKDLFQQTRMPNSGVPPRIKPITGYQESKNGQLQAKTDPVPEMLLGAAGVVSTAADLVRWNELLNNGKLLSEAMYKDMTTAYSPRQHPVVGKTGGGYGLMINADKSEIGHTGFLPEQGFIGINFYYPATHSSIVVLENIGSNPANMERAYYFEKTIHDIVLPVVIGK